jgi:hypothetical protein
MKENTFQFVSIANRKANSYSHIFGNVDGVNRCINCEIGSWNSWKESCTASPC